LKIINKLKERSNLIMEYILTMIFTTEGGKTSTFSINGVKQTLDKDQILALMDLIIEKDIFLMDSGALVGRSTAKITERKVTKFDVA